MTAGEFDSLSRLKQAVANAYSAGFDDARANTADAEHALPVAAGMAGPGELEQDVTEAKRLSCKAGRLIPETTILRRSNAGSITPRPIQATITVGCSRCIRVT
ncbi:MAG TPA: hypothetical protein VMZ32_02675 [Gammaproteobacteria bacterium]|nr:hypothetical protein [Gammaproteobacteria bacterium]